MFRHDSQGRRVMNTFLPTLFDWLMLRPLWQCLWALDRRHAPPTMSAEEWARRIDERLRDDAVLPGVRPARTNVIDATADYITWERLDRQRARAEQHRQLVGALPDLAFLSPPKRKVGRGLARLVDLVARGITKRQSSCNEALLAYAQGLAARLQACERQVLVQEEALRHAHVRLNQLEAGQSPVRHAA